MKSYDVVELLGDGISAELSHSVHRVAEVLPFKLDFRAVDLSLANRESTGSEGRNGGMGEGRKQTSKQGSTEDMKQTRKKARKQCLLTQVS